MSTAVLYDPSAEDKGVDGIVGLKFAQIACKNPCLLLLLLLLLL